MALDQNKPRVIVLAVSSIINLNRARKTRLRAEAEARAAENRVRFGRPKAERAAVDLERARTDRDLDHKKLDP